MKGDKDKEVDESQAWYLAEGARGQQMLDHGQAAEATTVFAAMLARIGDGPSFARSVILGRLGRCCQVTGRLELALQHAREALRVIGSLPPSDGVKGLRGTLRSDIGDALRAAGHYSDARKAYEAALKIAEELNDTRAQGVELGHLGALALTEGRLEDALTCQQAALGLFRRIDEPDMEAAAWHQLGRVFHKQGQWEEAERHYQEAGRISEERGRLASAARTFSQLAALAAEAGRSGGAETWYSKAIDVARRAGHPRQLEHCLHDFAGHLLKQPDRLADARQLAAEALAIAQDLAPAAAETWQRYGLLADIIDRDALTVADREQRTALETQARDYRELQRRAPVIADALTRIGPLPGDGRAVLLQQLGRSFHIGRRPDLAVACAREAINITTALAPGNGRDALQVGLHSDLGDMLRAAGRDADATAAYETALRIAARSQDILGQEQASQRLGRTFLLHEAPPPRDAAAFAVTIHDEVMTDYVFEPDLLVDGPRERRITTWTEAPALLSDAAQPELQPRARTWMDDKGSIHFGLPAAEPIVERHPGCTVMSRLQRTIAFAGNPRMLWHLLAGMDGARTAAEILARHTAGERGDAARLLATLAATGVVDDSGRAVARFVHTATKKGVMPAGGLDSETVLHLASDGRYREYTDTARIEVSPSVPDRIRAFHTLTRSRRSQRDYRGAALSRSDFDALLHTACGVTGAMPWAGREVKLRAYPSSGALYAVEIYPIVFRVEGLAAAVYHYRAPEHVLEVVKPNLDPASIVAAALPVEREMVAGAAALVCLAGWFTRHEQKYGQGGYRMLVAEAGHISMNLVLAATALGLSARPFGGVFDDLLNRELGLAHADEQFLLAVIVGHTASDGRI